MKDLKCIIIEDEPPALRKITGFIQKINYLQLTGAFDNALDALHFLKQNTVDLIFLDIQMEEFTGIQFLDTIKQKPKIIITSAYETYAIKGYEYDVTDYLLKPFTFDRFIQAVEKVANSLPAINEEPANDFIFIRTESRLEKVDFADILFIEGKSEYLRIVTVQRKIMTLQNFKSVEEVLPDNFIRVHKSFIVAINKIEAIEKSVIKIKDNHIPISDTYKAAFLAKIAILKK
jgi:two-component system LytT family response regulator